MMLWWRVLIHGTLSLLLVRYLYKTMFSVSIVLIHSQALFLVAQSLLLGYVTEYFDEDSPSEEETQKAYLLALGMSVLSLVLVTNNGLNAYFGMKLGMLVRITCTSAIYQKV